MNLIYIIYFIRLQIFIFASLILLCAIDAANAQIIGYTDNLIKMQLPVTRNAFISTIFPFH